MRKYKLDGLTYHVIRVDSTWSIAYDPNNNDRPVYWLRHGERHSEFDEKNGVVAMFYLLLEMGKN